MTVCKLGQQLEIQKREANKVLENTRVPEMTE